LRRRIAAAASVSVNSAGSFTPREMRRAQRFRLP
jgi:hypothetical protein